MFIESLKAVTEKVDSDVLHPEHISPFQALMISPPVESA
ncbi:Putative amino-acid transport protein [Campylobacter fetus subsp. venerealis str. 84-112]|nr:Putative amino-acid transport protein [Campylobacter fetus subsp. venerealis str. 84-112]